MALRLGRTVEELENSMSYSEYTDWIEYSRYEPLQANEIQLAVISSLITATGGKPIPMNDFMPSTDELKSNKPEKMDGKLLDQAIRGMF